jgi:hypothetical protein
VVTGPDAVRGARFGVFCSVVVTGAGWLVDGAAIRGLGASVVVTGGAATVVGGAGGGVTTGAGVVGGAEG